MQNTLLRKSYHRSLIYIQQDNDPNQTAQIYRDFLEKGSHRRSFAFGIWPPQTPVLSPVELSWNELERETKTRQSQNSQ